MAQTMSPSENMTAGQIGKLQDLLAAALRKAHLRSQPTQEIIEHQGNALAADFVAVIRRYVEANSNLIIRRVKVNRSRTPQEVLETTGCKRYIDRKVVDAMPRGEGEEVEVIFFKLGRYVSDNDLDKEYELRGLKPADAYSVAAVNEADPLFSGDKPNSTHWKDSKGKWCYFAFSLRLDGERSVGVYHKDTGWNSDWWFAGLRK